MQFIVLGYDGEDEDALQRRLAVREEHVALGDQLRAEGKAVFGVAMLDDDGQMIGSIYVMEFETREELDEWLKVEPYVTGDVWRRVEVIPAKVGPSFIN